MNQPTDRIALDCGLGTLTVKLTLNETLLIQGLLNNPDRIRLNLRLSLGDTSPARAEFFVEPTPQ